MISFGQHGRNVAVQLQKNSREKEDMTKLTAGQKHLLALISRDRNVETGWTVCSKILYPHVVQIPHDLVQGQELDGAFYVKLTARGEAIIDAMKII